MDKERIELVLNMVAAGQLSPGQALEQLRDLPYADLGFAKLDLHRQLRQGMPEVVFCPGKTPTQIIEILQNFKEHHSLALASRATPEVAAQVLAKVSDAVYNESARTIICGALPKPDPSLAPVAVLTAGTADLPVAEEAALVLQSQAIPVLRLNDVGVAGIHRLLVNLETLKEAAASIVVAGMDGALPSVVGGLVQTPVIAVPTSVGYGSSFEGIAALLTMLNSCAAGVTVCNIDNGFGAGVAAARIIKSARVNQILNRKTSP